MGAQIIRQPDGRYALFSSITGTVNIWNATEDEIVEECTERAVRLYRTDRTEANREARRLLSHVATGEPRRAYGRFTMAWEKAVAMDREHDGEAWEEWNS